MELSIKNYYLSIENCLTNIGYSVLFYGSWGYFNDVRDLLDNDMIDYILDRDNMTIVFNNGSTMYFIRDIDSFQLNEKEFNMVFVSEREPIRERLLGRVSIN